MLNNNQLTSNQANLLKIIKEVLRANLFLNESYEVLGAT